MQKPDQPSVILITGSSGAGKDTILAELVKKYRQLTAAVSVTTRWPAREGEKFLESYYFVDNARFDWLVQTGQLIERTAIYDHRYGTLVAELERIMSTGRTPIVAVDSAGLEHYAALGYATRAVFLDFPNASEQKRRLLEREPHIDHIELDHRLSTAASERAWALRQASAGQLTIATNDKLGACVQEIAEILKLS